MVQLSTVSDNSCKAWQRLGLSGSRSSPENANSPDPTRMSEILKNNSPDLDPKIKISTPNCSEKSEQVGAEIRSKRRFNFLLTYLKLIFNKIIITIYINATLY